MNKIYYLLVVAFLAVSCAVEGDPTIGDGVEGVRVTLSASIDSRVAIGDRDSNGIKLDWDDDSFEVYDASGAFVGTFSNDGEGGSDFSAIDVAMVDGASYTAYYPTRSATLGDVTQSVNGVYADGLDDMILMEKEFTYNASGISLTFDHKVTFFEFMLSTSTYGVAPEKLVYDDGNGGEYTINYSGEESVDDLYTLYTVVNPASGGSRDMKITVTDRSYNTYVYTYTTIKDHDPGVLYKSTLTSPSYSMTTTPAGLMDYVFTDYGDITRFYISTEITKASKGSVTATADGMRVDVVNTRADLTLSNPVVDVVNYPILAIKCSFRGVKRFILYLGSEYGYYNDEYKTNSNYDGVTGKDDDIYYYDMSNKHDKRIPTTPTMLKYIDWVTTYEASGDSTLVEWIKTFSSVEELEKSYGAR